MQSFLWTSAEREGRQFAPSFLMSNPALADIASIGLAMVSEVQRFRGSAAKTGHWGPCRSLDPETGRLRLWRLPRLLVAR